MKNLTNFQVLMLGLIIILLGCGFVTHKIAGTLEATIDNQNEVLRVLEEAN